MNNSDHLGKQHRSSNLDLLRIVATLFVIMLHYNNTSGGKAFLYTKDLGYHFQLLLMLESFSICAVNLFVLITGYFQSTSHRVTLAKPFTLLAELTIISFFRFLIACALGQDSFTISGLIQCVIPTNWYIAVYIALYLCSPYINVIIKNLSPKQFKTMLLVLFCTFSVWAYLPTMVLDFTGFDMASPIGSGGSNDGYTVVNFVLLYTIGAYLRAFPFQQSSKRLLFCSGIVYMVASISIFLGSRLFFTSALSYCNPLVIIQSTALFIFFCNLRISSACVSKVASTSFGVYLLHSFFYPFIGVKEQVTGPLWGIPIHATLSCVIIYLIAGIVYRFYSLTLGRIVKAVSTRLFQQIYYEV